MRSVESQWSSQASDDLEKVRPPLTGRSRDPGDVEQPVVVQGQGFAEVRA
jgi:hypothetical protein